MSAGHATYQGFVLRTVSMVIVATMASVAIETPVQATLLYAEPFNYPNGDLVNGTNGPNMPNPPFWIGTNAGFNGVPSHRVQVVNGVMHISPGTPSYEDPNLPSGSTLGQGQTWYAGYDLIVQSESGSGQNELSRFFLDQSQFAAGFYVTTTFSTPAMPRTTYEVGLDAPGPDAPFPAQLSFGVPYRVVISYTLNPDNNPTTDDSFAQLWVDPIDESSPSVTALTSSVAVTSFGFRWPVLNGSTDRLIDNLILATSFAEAVPEPSTIMLLALGTIGLLFARR